MVWSDIVPCKVWKETQLVEHINKVLIKFNRELGHFMAWYGAVVVRQRDLE